MAVFGKGKLDDSGKTDDTTDTAQATETSQESLPQDNKGEGNQENQSGGPDDTTLKELKESEEAGTKPEGDPLDAPVGGSTTSPSDAGQGQTGNESIDAAAKERERRLDTDQENLAPTDADIQYHEPTAEDLGLDAVDAVGTRNPIDALTADMQAAGSTVFAAAPDDSVTYSSHPIASLSMGPYEFVDSLLILKADEVEKFEDLLKAMPYSESSKVYKVDTSRANAIIEANRQVSGTKDFDSSVGRDALQRMQADFPKTGKDDLGRTDEGR